MKMKKEVIGKLFFALIIFSFLISGIFAAVPSAGTCIISTRADCTNDITNGYVIMGLSAPTNAHGQLNKQTPVYDSVLCCGFGDGVTDCNGANKIIGLSSSINAHAEEPLSNIYSATNNVCYGDLSCAYSTTTCPTNNIGVLSLSATTNAHIGAFADYSTKICCSGTLTYPCTLDRAFWSLDGINPVSSSDSALTGQKAFLVVKGSGSECGGKSVSFTTSPSATTNPVNVPFSDDTAKGEWTTEWQGTGIFGTADPSYSFTATLVSDTTKTKTSENPLLLVKKPSDADCAGIVTCDKYKDANQCNTNTPCSVNLVEQGTSVGVDCTASDTNCACAWDTTTSTCGFTSGPINPFTPTCSDEIVSAGEDCEPTLGLDGKTCSNFDSFTGGTLNCGSPTSSNPCKWDTFACTGGTTGSCGDGTINTGEVCDGTALSGKTCHDVNSVFTGGTLSCDSRCSFDTTQCTGSTNGCGNGYTLCFDTSGASYCYPGNTCPGAGGCPTHPTNDEVCSGTAQFDILDTSTGVVCRTVLGTKTCTAVCPTLPPASSICSGTTDLTYNSAGEVCGAVVGTKDCGTSSHCNNDGVCEFGEEGCTCADCEGKQDTCTSGLLCSAGTCYSSILPIVDPTCSYGYTLCHKAGSSPSRNYCYFGNVCPTGDESLSNNDGKCDLGEGCSSADCKDGDLDSCSRNLFCRSEKCYNSVGPLTFGLCKISQSITKNCDVEPVGYQTIVATGTWTGADSTKKGKIYDWCIHLADKPITALCPAQVQLPFFDYLGMIGSVVIIALIYVGLIFKKKILRKK